MPEPTSPRLPEFCDHALDVPAHLCARLPRIVSCQGVEYALMICDRCFAQGGGMKMFLHFFPHRSVAAIPNGANDLGQHGVPGCRCNCHMKRFIRSFVGALIAQ